MSAASLAASSASSSAVTAIVLICSFVGLLTAVWFAYQVSRVRVSSSSSSTSSHGTTAQSKLIPKGEHKESSDDDEFHADVATIGKAISEGANAFLFQEYEYMGVFVLLFGILLLILLGVGHTWYLGLFAMIAFFCGATTSVLCGFIGMRIAVYANVRTAISAQRGCAESASKGFELAFDTAFKGGAVMGFALVSLGLLVLYILINAFHLYWSNAFDNDTGFDATKDMYEAIAGYGLGGSTVALFGRVGGGIYTKAADVGADLAGKVEEGLPEDDPRNPACIADNVGDNVGDIAGMGADLFGSFAESSCATMVISSQSLDLFHDWPAMCFPLVLTAAGIIVCLLTTFVATHLMPTKKREEVEPSLKRQLLVSTLIMTPVVYGLTQGFLPDEFILSGFSGTVKNWYIFFTISVGLWSGLVIGYITEYYTSHAYTPVREVAGACTTGAATNIIYGLALGYQSVIIPAICIAITIYTSYSLAGMYGIATAALGILSTLSVGLTIDGYGPICDNAGGIAEMAGMPRDVRVVTDSLDAAGNTTAAIGKGFAIGSAAFVSLALFGAFVTAKDLQTVDILQPFQFSGLLIGAMLPYWFSAMTMKSVGQAALAMVEEVRRQFSTCPLDEEGKKNLSAFRPDYAHCVAISTKAALHKMIPPGLLVLLTPIVVGFFFGVEALCGVLAGALVSGVQMAISAANSGGAWDNAKKYIEIDGKGSEKHKAAVIGDTVGDPLKDTSGPSLNILIKLMAIISLVFAPAFPSTDKGGLLVQLFHQ